MANRKKQVATECKREASVVMCDERQSARMEGEMYGTLLSTLMLSG